MRTPTLTTTPSSMANTPPPSTPSLQHYGATLLRWQEQVDARIATAAREREARRATFTGECRECLDTGPCPHCPRGQAVRATQERERRAARGDAALRAGGITGRCQAFTLDSYPDQGHPALRHLRAYLDTFDGTRGLILTGPYGTGKTGLLVGALRALAEGAEGAAIGFRYHTGPDLFDWLRAGYDSHDYAERLERVRRARLLAIDDLGAEKPTEKVQEQVFSIVNHRYEQGLPTWLTTNCGLAALAARIGERSVWRLAETCTVIEVGGQNLRVRGAG